MIIDSGPEFRRMGHRSFGIREQARVMISTDAIAAQKVRSVFRVVIATLVLGLTLAMGFEATAADGDLSISLSKPLKGYMAEIMGNGRYVYLEGEIDAQAGQRLENFLKKNDVPYTSTIVLNSPGGSLGAGMDLGRVIRKYGLSTTVGRKEPHPAYDGVTAGACMSSCTLAYLGGTFRYLPAQSRFGVHRFYATKPSDLTADTAQMLSAFIVTYMKEMDIDVELYRLSTLAGGDEIYDVPPATLERLGVVNKGFERPKWTIEGNNDLVYLKGERNTAFGVNKFIIYCGSSQPFLHVIFDPQGRTEEVMGLNQHDLVIDGQNIPVTPTVKDIKNGWYNGVYNLSPRLLAAIAKAQTVGMMLRPTSQAPIFLGFDKLPLAGGEQKVRSYLSTCRRS
jgi:hypothetical protein